MEIHKNYELFLSVIESNKGIVYKIANSFCKDADDKKDLTQEVILRLWKSFGTYNDQFKHSTWVYRIALNVAISYYRKEKSRRKINLPISPDIFAVGDFESINPRVQEEFILSRIFAELKNLDRALMLLYLEEKSHKEISQITGLTETNVATKIARIKIILKQKSLQFDK